MRLSDFGPTTRAPYKSNHPFNPRCPKCGSYAISIRMDTDGVEIIACREEECQYAVELAYSGGWEAP